MGGSIRRACVLAAILTALFRTAVCHAESCGSLVATANGLYEQGLYEAAIDAYRAALAQPDCAKLDREQLHLGLAKALATLERHDEAVTEMKAALHVNPFLTLDPVATSPKVLNVLHDARRKLEAESLNGVSAGGHAAAPARQAMSAQRVGAWTTLAVGAASAVGGGVMLGLAFDADHKQRDARDRGDYDARDRYWAQTQTDSMLSYGLLGLAGASLGTSLVLFLWPEDNPAASAGGSRRSHDRQSSPSLGGLAPALIGDQPGLALAVRW